MIAMAITHLHTMNIAHRDLKVNFNIWFFGSVVIEYLIYHVMSQCVQRVYVLPDDGREIFRDVASLNMTR